MVYKSLLNTPKKKYKNPNISVFVGITCSCSTGHVVSTSRRRFGRKTRLILWSAQGSVLYMVVKCGYFCVDRDLWLVITTQWECVGVRSFMAQRNHSLVMTARNGCSGTSNHQRFKETLISGFPQTFPRYRWVGRHPLWWTTLFCKAIIPDGAPVG